MPTVSTLKNWAVSPNPYPRVGQLDALTLDGELISLLRDQLESGFKYFHPELRTCYSAELLLLLKAIVFKYTVWDHSASYGMKLQNLQMVDGRKTKPQSATSSATIPGVQKLIYGPPLLFAPMSSGQRAVYGVVTVAGDYIWNKVESYLYSFRPEDYDYSRPVIARLIRIAQSGVRRVSQMYTLVSLLNFIIFLITGRYSTMLLRLLRVQIVPNSRADLRRGNLNFEFQNRQLVWNALTEFLLFVLPLVNMKKWRKRAEKAARTVVAALAPVGDSGVGGEAGVKGGETKRRGALYFLPEKTCAICYETSDAATGQVGTTVNTDVTNPFETDCGHIYCYTCIVGKLEDARDGGDDSGWTCLRCGEVVQAARPFRDVDVGAVYVNPEYEEMAEEIEEEATVEEKEEKAEEPEAQQIGETASAGQPTDGTSDSGPEYFSGDDSEFEESGSSSEESDEVGFFIEE